MCRILGELLKDLQINCSALRAIGISCGGPLDSRKGIIQSPPNLPGWDDVYAVEIVEKLTSVRTILENDANACALAEWRYGAGKGTENMVFLTFGTGLGAGVIVNGRLLQGASGMAGECGHIRLAPHGPVGYGKHGSFEGFCSGGGIAQLGRFKAEEALENNVPLAWCPTYDDLKNVSAKTIADAADSGDEAALAVYEHSGRMLGHGLSILIDILNCERIVIGSIFSRSENLLRPAMQRVIDEEALPQSSSVCKVVPAELGEAIGDIASLAVAAG
jgi:glucokinase